MPLPRHLLVCGILALSVPAAAQGPTTASSASTATTSSAPPSSDPLRSELESVAQDARAISRRLVRELDRARVERRADRAACLDRALSQVHAVLRQVDHRRRRVARAGPAARRHHAATLPAYRERLRALRIEGRRCVGEGPAMRPSITRVVVTVAPDVPDEDPTRRPRERSAALLVPPP